MSLHPLCSIPRASLSMNYLSTCTEKTAYLRLREPSGVLFIIIKWTTNCTDWFWIEWDTMTNPGLCCWRLNGLLPVWAIIFYSESFFLFFSLLQFEKPKVQPPRQKKPVYPWLTLRKRASAILTEDQWPTGACTGVPLGNVRVKGKNNSY